MAQVLAERTRDTDLDKDQKLAEAKKDADRALVTADTDVPTAGAPPDRLEAYKGFLRSEAYAVLGTIAFNQKAWPEAETDLRKSIDAFPQQPDAIAVFRLAVALDMQGKYPEATKFCNQAVDLTKEGTAAGTAAPGRARPAGEARLVGARRRRQRNRPLRSRSDGDFGRQFSIHEGTGNHGAGNGVRPSLQAAGGD